MMRRSERQIWRYGTVLRSLPIAVIASFVLPTQPSYAACTPATPCVEGPTDLGTLGGTQSTAYLVSDDGTVVAGQSYISVGFNQHGYRWEGGTMTDLGTLGGTNMSPYDMSGDGSVIVGLASIAGGDTHAFRWEGGTLTDLGTLGGSASIARAVSADGTVVAGYADTATETHAFRWEGGTMTDLGTLGGTYSSADYLSSDGSVVAGSSTLSGGGRRAFRWEANVMTDLGTLGGSDSNARALSDDGSVVAGNSTTAAGDFHGFRWTAATGMTDLGTLGGTYTYVIGMSRDGLVVFGDSNLAGDVEDHAFRWAGGTMTDLGTLGGPDSFANASNSDGSIIVGESSTAGGGYRAFRWTSATGMRDLNTLMSDAGVNMTGIVLEGAKNITPDGQFIVGFAQFTTGPHGFLLRYCDGTSGCTDAPIGGITTTEAVQSSLNNLAEAHRGVMAQQHGLLAPLLGADKPIAQKNEAGVFGAAGSASGGGFMQLATGYGFSVLGGIAYAEEDYPDAEIKNGVSGALALRYVGAPVIGGWQPLFEGGGWYTGGADLDFERTYANGAGTAKGVGSTDGDLSYFYLRAGLVADYGAADQFLAAVEIGRERMEFDGYSETFSAANPFEAHVASGTDTLNLAKIKLAWSHRFSSVVDSTLWVAGVRDFNYSNDVEAFVPGFGTLVAADPGNTTWVEYGARVGVKLVDNVTLDGFVTGVSGGNGIDSRVHGGGALRFQF